MTCIYFFCGVCQKVFIEEVSEIPQFSECLCFAEGSDSCHISLMTMYLWETFFLSDSILGLLSSMERRVLGKEALTTPSHAYTAFH